MHRDLSQWYVLHSRSVGDWTKALVAHVTQCAAGETDLPDLQQREVKEADK